MEHYEDHEDFDSLVFDIAYERARRFIHEGYPGVPMDDDPMAWYGACGGEAERLAAEEASEAGFDPDDPRVERDLEDGVEHAFDLADNAARVAHHGGGGGEEMAMYEAWQAPLRPAPRPKSVDRPVPRTSCGVRHRRGRAPRRGTNGRTRGSRRTTGSRAGPDDEGELPSDIAWPLPIGGRR